MEIQKEQMTMKEVLDDVYKMLGEVKVPMNLFEDIGVPIKRALAGIDACLDAIARAEMAEQMKAQIEAQAQANEATEVEPDQNEPEAEAETEETET